MREFVHPVVTSSTYLDDLGRRHRFIFLVPSGKLGVCHREHIPFHRLGQIWDVKCFVINVRLLCEVIISKFCEFLFHPFSSNGVLALYDILLRVVFDEGFPRHRAAGVLEQNGGYLLRVSTAYLTDTLLALDSVLNAANDRLLWNHEVNRDVLC
ncbi:hypothetical protein ATCV1_z748R [Acanthocystis turfacea chlorella virus 1]|uniref:Uncharacterized protein z748R n=1 Tax=Chlorovirus heliozoae TaxID=322019 RepID=A7KA08_9PHYC|nr:hypothetical protein ATCV1_z748R [Acanthocystis turfacea chlorella virus 1]ABT16882.1 hypothetical protein ATCV1_z748R [Acanthocystis turfacea chlorella virus 1]